MVQVCAVFVNEHRLCGRMNICEIIERPKDLNKILN